VVATISGSDTNVGSIADLLHANTHTQVWVAGGALSGPLPVFIQTSDVTTSGDFTDPTSGLPVANFPLYGFVVSGGIFYANSGLWGSGNSSPQGLLNSGPLLCSGGIVFASFQRPHRYARLIITSGNASIGAFIGMAGFIGSKKTTGSGGGFTYAPGSGTVNV
jgi:hypothetical protein